jgi:hypothetical protein
MFISSDLYLSLVGLVWVTPIVLVVCLAGVYYMRRVRLDRPPIGTFNGRDIATLFVFVNLIPLFYLQLSRWWLIFFLGVTFASALSIGYKNVVRPVPLWLGIGVLIGANLWLGQNAFGTVAGWQLYWAENDLLVILAAVAVANLYVQGGMKMRQVIGFILLLAVYDSVFISIFPVTSALVQSFLGWPLDPSVGMRVGINNFAIGIGDLFVYALFTIASLKAYGKVAARVALAVVMVFGAVVPSLIPLLINYVNDRLDTTVPSQLWFGPAAFVAWLWMRRRYGTERTMQEFLASDDAVRPRIESVPTSPAPAFAPREEEKV